MKPVLSFVVIVSWGLWFGGIIALFLFVSRLFARGMGPEAAPVLFLAWEPFQLIVAAAAVIATFFWWTASASRWKIALFVLLSLSAVSATVSATVITPRIDALRLDGQSATPEFKRLHGQSMMLYTSQAALLLLAAIPLTAECRPRPVATRDADADSE